jgi:hypothetical protein
MLQASPLPPVPDMTHANLNSCPSASTLQRIAAARWTPYVADTLQNWARDALSATSACAASRAGDCEACRALHTIVSLGWSEVLGQRVQQLAREALGLPTLRNLATRGISRASA